MKPLAPRTEYTLAERRSDAAIHVAGVTAATIAVPVLIALAVILRGDRAAVLGSSIYGMTLFAMILCSGLYNMITSHRWQALLRRLDHSAIYAKIAGTYTPFTLLSGGSGGYLLTVIWAAAFAGIGLKIFSPERYRWLALALYLAMGWAGLLAGGSFLATLSVPVIVLIVTGGLLYTAGVVFYLFERLPFHYTIWHVFVLAASIVFYAAVTVNLVQSVA